MRFVDDKDFVAQLHRTVADGAAHFLDIGNPTMRGGIHLDYIYRATGGDIPARVADVAWFRDRVCRRFTVECFGEKTRDRGLRGSSGSGKKIAMRDSAGNERVLQGAHHMPLTDHIGEGLRAIFAVQGLVSHTSKRVWRERFALSIVTQTAVSC